MTPEEKQLLLKDLCARLPYGIQAQVKGHINHLQILSISKLHRSTWAWKKGTYVASFWNDTKSIDAIKPYLRPMSSMTEEEKKTLNNILEYQYCSDDSCMCESTDWLNAHHLDYRGLIEKGLALEAPEGTYKTE